ncbi:helix-turn-helix domain-containing protein [Maribacter aestuarii]|uniref:helix-turn-helix domain-containing protein n=1 Tax=Maribacter aestuarii TaxID=1130723 RepID=UPI0025A5A2B4|nr:AraC family transcriptional regulator [Maribacter aestuarii]
MTDLNLINVLSILSLFLGLLFTVFLFSAKGKNRFSNRIFGVFLLLSAIDNVFVSRLLNDNYLALSTAISTTVFLQLPIFFLYVNSVCYTDFKLKKIYLLHAIPYIIVNLLMLSSNYGIDSDSPLILLSGLSVQLKNKIIHIIIHVQVFSYLLASYMVVRRSKKLYLENYANAAIPFYHWLLQLMSVLFILHVTALFKNIYKFSSDDVIYRGTLISLISLELLIFCWYVLKALNHPELFKSVDSKLKLTSDLIKAADRSTVLSAHEDEEVRKVRSYMSAEKPFLEPSLTINELADYVQLPTKDLSIIINHKMGQHFFDFVNEFRISEAKKLLKNPDKKEYTVLEILYEVGFNSKSSFNTAFKKNTGLTPTAYRKLDHL